MYQNACEAGCEGVTNTVEDLSQCALEEEPEAEEKTTLPVGARLELLLALRWLVMSCRALLLYCCPSHSMGGQRHVLKQQ